MEVGALGQMRPKLNFVHLEQNAMSNWNITLYISLSTPLPLWKVAASCCGGDFLQQGQGRRLGLMARCMEQNTGQSLKETCRTMTLQPGFRSKHINVLEWPSQIPDLNPTDNLGHLKIAACRRSHPIWLRLSYFARMVKKWVENLGMWALQSCTVQ